MTRPNDDRSRGTLAARVGVRRLTLGLIAAALACGDTNRSGGSRQRSLDEPIEFRTVEWRSQGWCPDRQPIECYRSVLVRSGGNVQVTVGHRFYADTRSPENVEEVAALATSPEVIAAMRSRQQCGATDSRVWLEIEIAQGLWVRKMILGCDFPAVEHLVDALHRVSAKYFPQAPPLGPGQGARVDSPPTPPQTRATVDGDPLWGVE